MKYKKLYKTWNKFLLKEELCEPNGRSSGFIKPDGEYIEVNNHLNWAKANVPKLFPNWEEEMSKIKRVPTLIGYLILVQHWIRVANAFKHAGGEIKNITSQQIHTIQQLLKKCPPIPADESFYFDHYGSGYIKEPTEQRFLMRLQGKELAKSQVSMFREI